MIEKMTDDMEPVTNLDEILHTIRFATKPQFYFGTSGAKHRRERIGPIADGQGIIYGCTRTTCMRCIVPDGIDTSALPPATDEHSTKWLRNMRSLAWDQFDTKTGWQTITGDFEAYKLRYDCCPQGCSGPLRDRESGDVVQLGMGDCPACDDTGYVLSGMVKLNGRMFNLRLLTDILEGINDPQFLSMKAPKKDDPLAIRGDGGTFQAFLMPIDLSKSVVPDGTNRTGRKA